MSGRFRGFSPSPSTASASGIWSARDVLVYRAAAEWPPAPTVPSAPVVVFDPGSIAGLSGWWDAYDSATLFDAASGGSAVAADGGVARWEDKSGNGRHFFQPSSTAMPTYKQAAYNSLGVVRFDGSDDRMVSTQSLYAWLMTDIVAANECTCFIVAKAATVSSAFGQEPDMQSVLASQGGADGFVSLRTGNLVSSFGYSGFAFATATAAYSPGNWAMFTTLHGSSSLSIKVNNNTPSSTSIGARSFSDQLVILGANYSEIQCFHGDIGEIIVYNVALSAGDRAAVESYLMAKWAIS